MTDVCCRACADAAASKNSRNAHRSDRLKRFGEHADLSDAAAFAAWLAPPRLRFLADISTPGKYFDPLGRRAGTCPRGASFVRNGETNG